MELKIELNSEKTTSESNYRVHSIQKVNDRYQIRLANKPEIVVFEGGGAKGLAYPGATQALTELGVLDSVMCFAGSSAGAINAFVCSLGYRGIELTQKVDEVDSTILVDRQMLDPMGKAYMVASTLGGATKKRLKQEGEGFINTGNNLLMHARKIIKDRFQACFNEAPKEIQSAMVHYGIKSNMDRDRITFIDLKYMSLLFPNASFTDLIVTGTRVFGYTGYILGQDYFNYEDTPHAEVAQAVRISASIPFVFKRARYLGQYYIDGGVTQNLPLDFFMNHHNEKYSKKQILALKFKRPVKDTNQNHPTKKNKERTMQWLSGNNFDTEVWEKYSFANGNLLKRAQKHGVELFEVQQGQLETMSFDADKKTVTDAREDTYSACMTQFKTNTIGLLEELSVDNVDLYINGQQSEMVTHELIRWVKNNQNTLEVDKTVDSKNVKPNFEMIDKLSQSIVARQIQLFKSMDDYAQDRFNDKNNSKAFDFLYEHIENEIKLTKEKIKNLSNPVSYNVENSFYTNRLKWLIDLNKYASAFDMVLNRGVIFSDSAMLYAKQSIKIEIEYRTDFLKNLSSILAKEYGFTSISELKDAMGEYAKANYIQNHKDFFKSNNPKFVQDLLSSPFVIKAILGLMRLADLELIEYGEGLIESLRSKLVTGFKKEIIEGNTCWLTDLFICCKLYDDYCNNKGDKDFNLAFYKDSDIYNNKSLKQDFAYYIEYMFEKQYGITLNEDTFQSHCSAIVMLFTNRKLANEIKNSGDRFGDIGVILSDMGSQVFSYFNGLVKDLDLSSQLDLQFSVLPTKEERLRLIEPVVFKNNNADRILSIECFNPDIYAEKTFAKKILPIETNRKIMLQKLCDYINTNPLTWHEDLFGIDSTFEFKKNPLLTILHSKYLNPTLARELIFTLEKWYYIKEPLPIFQKSILVDINSEEIESSEEDIDSDEIVPSIHPNYLMADERLAREKLAALQNHIFSQKIDAFEDKTRNYFFNNTSEKTLAGQPNEEPKRVRVTPTIEKMLNLMSAAHQGTLSFREALYQVVALSNKMVSTQPAEVNVVNIAKELPFVAEEQNLVFADNEFKLKCTSIIQTIKNTSWNVHWLAGSSRQDNQWDERITNSMVKMLDEIGKSTNQSQNWETTYLNIMVIAKEAAERHRCNGLAGKPSVINKTNPYEFYNMLENQLASEPFEQRAGENIEKIMRALFTINDPRKKSNLSFGGGEMVTILFNNQTSHSVKVGKHAAEMVRINNLVNIGKLSKAQGLDLIIKIANKAVQNKPIFGKRSEAMHEFYKEKSQCGEVRECNNTSENKVAVAMQSKRISI